MHSVQNRLSKVVRFLRRLPLDGYSGLVALVSNAKKAVEMMTERNAEISQLCLLVEFLSLFSPFFFFFSFLISYKSFESLLDIWDLLSKKLQKTCHMTLLYLLPPPPGFFFVFCFLREKTLCNIIIFPLY